MDITKLFMCTAASGGAPTTYNYPIMAVSQASMSNTNNLATGITHGADIAWTSTIANVSSVTPVDIDVSNFKFVLTTAPGGSAERTIGFYDDGSAVLSAVITGTATDDIDTNTATIAAGSSLRIQNVNTVGTPASNVVSLWRVDCESLNQVLSSSTGGTTSASGTRYYPLMGNTGTAFTAIASAEQVFPIAGTLKTAMVKNMASALTSGSWTIDLMINGSTSGVTMTVNNSGVTFSDSSNSVAVVPGDLGCWRVTPGSPQPNAAKALGFGIEFECSVAGTGVVLGVTGANSSNTTTQYGWMGMSSAWNATESNRQALARASTVTDLYIKSGAVPGAAKSWIATVRKNGSGTSATATITGASSTDASWNGSVSYADDDLICFEMDPDGSPTSTWVKCSIAYHA